MRNIKKNFLNGISDDTETLSLLPIWPRSKQVSFCALITNSGNFNIQRNYWVLYANQYVTNHKLRDYLPNFFFVTGDLKDFEST